MQDACQIRDILIELLENDTGNSFADIRNEDNLREGLGLDSVDLVSVISQIERRFHIRLTHEELEQLKTVGDVLTLLETKIDETSPAQSIKRSAA
ncbi:MAG: acyl carrier protein [Gemmataceae bacterium]